MLITLCDDRGPVFQNERNSPMKTKTLTKYSAVILVIALIIAIVLTLAGIISKSNRPKTLIAHEKILQNYDTTILIADNGSRIIRLADPCAYVSYIEVRWNPQNEDFFNEEERQFSLGDLDDLYTLLALKHELLIAEQSEDGTITYKPNRPK